jgi:hypothetical protein
MRRQGYLAQADAELYQSFDLTYDYDIHDDWVACVTGQISLNDYVQALARQEVIYPANFIKLRFVENHDQPRAAALIPDRNQLKCWTAFMAFNRGAFLIYAGQESAATKLPSLFEADPVDWPAPGDKPVLSDFLTRLARLKKDPATDGTFELIARDTHLQARWENRSQGLYGIFNVRGHTGRVAVDLPDGRYVNLLDDTKLVVSQGQIELPLTPVVVKYSPPDNS